MKNIRNCLFATLLFGGAWAQVRKADALAAEGNYKKAIPIYKKEAATTDGASRQEVMLKLAAAYQKEGLIKESEDTYREVINSGVTVPAEAYYQYAQALTSDMQYEAAAQQYAAFIKMQPGDPRAERVRKLVGELQQYTSTPARYGVKNLSSINTGDAEFSPVVAPGKLIFAADRRTFGFDDYKIKNDDGELMLDIYVSEQQGSLFKEPRPFAKTISLPGAQYGPATLSADGKTLYYTRLPGNAAKAKSEIYAATGPDWTNTEVLSLCSSDHHAAHPSISADNDELYFTSDMAGGFGGKDIWVSEKKNGSWSTPVNLGPDVNTQGDEMFPVIAKNDVLYFSSNGLPGFGGLDIYSAKKNQRVWTLLRNEGLSLNSNKDDFGVTFLTDTTGYFSSDRPGGKGKDDIYQFTYHDRSKTIAGHLLLTADLRDHAKRKKVLLMNDNLVAIDSTMTDSTGRFVFKVIDVEKHYLVAVEETDPALEGKARYYYSYDNTVVQRVSAAYKWKRFVFRNIPTDANALPELYTEDDLVLAGTLHYGDHSTPLANARIRIVNSFGDVVEETRTNEFGSFAFRKIPSDQNYLVTIEDAEIQLPEGTKITLLNRSGKTVKVFHITQEKFNFKILTTDVTMIEEMKAEDVDLVMGIFGYVFGPDKSPVANANIRIKEADGSDVQTSKTDSRGRFHFKSLNTNKDYIFEADVSDPALKGMERIFIGDSKGRIYKMIELTNGVFEFKILETDKFLLGEFVADDPWLQLAELKRPQAKTGTDNEESSITIIENIYYAFGDHKLSPAAEIILNKAVNALKSNPALNMEISSHTDSKSSDEFNMKLSKKRAQTAVDYIVSNGISKSRLRATGYGESKLLNECSNDVPCTEEQHEKNRRTEFKFTQAERQ